MKILEKKTTFGIIIGSRNIFNSELALDARKDITELLEKLDYNYIITEKDATNYGAIETLKEARICSDLFKNHRDSIDGIIVIMPNFSDELGIISVIDSAKLNVPILVQACNDENNKVDVYSRRDAFCGKISVTNNLYQYQIPFTDTTSHTVDINSEEFKNDVNDFAKVCRVVKGLRNMRIGCFGARPAAFNTVRFSEKLLQASGINVTTFDLSEILYKAEGVKDDSPELKEMLEELSNYGKIPSHIQFENIKKQAKFSLVINNYMKEYDLDASTIQCWDSVQNNYGCATCVTMSMMGEKFMPSACESDVAGVVSMYTLLLASNNAPAILDWNNNYGNDPEKCVCTHCSNYPKSFMGNELEISNLDILGTVLDPQKCFGAIKGKVAPGDMTYFRLSTDDVNGKLKAYVGEGEFTDDPYGMDGGIAVTKVKNLRNLLKYICQEGFEHHVAMSRGLNANIVEEALVKYLKWDLHYHK
ncbi:MAG: hypothetical protein OQJ81_09805 [Melioribacteraceae bacterium]|nr:hypothetical protein [Melioribacteraceae bacterium]